ncbi:MAG: PIG-L deacetylase family protein [Anaerolineales bacterium]
MTINPDTYLEDLPTPERVLIVMAHPDDAEFFAGGTLAKWAAAGAHLTLFLVTSGDKGSGDLEHDDPQQVAALREAETQAAAERLGIAEVIFLRWGDGELMPSLALRRHIVRMIRLQQPDAVMSSDPLRRYRGHTGLNHPDHYAVAEAVQNAVYPAARDHLNYLELYQDEGLVPHKARWLYKALATHPNYRVDTTAYRERQIAALQAHRSQVGEPDEFAKKMRERPDEPPADDGSPRFAEYFRVIDLHR